MAGVRLEAELVVDALGKLKLHCGRVAAKLERAEEVRLKLTLLPPAVAAVRERTTLARVEVVADGVLVQVDNVGHARLAEHIRREVRAEPRARASRGHEEILDQYLGCGRSGGEQDDGLYHIQRRASH